MEKIILLGGKSGSGKNTVANMFQAGYEKKGYRVHQMAFADFSKRFCKSYFEWDGIKDKEGRQLLITVAQYILKMDWQLLAHKYKLYWSKDYKIIPKRFYKSYRKRSLLDKFLDLFYITKPKYYGYKNFNALALYTICRSKLKFNKNFFSNNVIDRIERSKYSYDVFIITDLRFPGELRALKTEYTDKVEYIEVRRDSYFEENHKNNYTENSLQYYTPDAVIINDSDLETLESTVDVLVKYD